MLDTSIQYQHIVQLEKTKSGIEIYTLKTGYLLHIAEPEVLFRINEGKDGKYNVEVLSDKVNLITKT